MSDLVNELYDMYHASATAENKSKSISSWKPILSRSEFKRIIDDLTQSDQTDLTERRSAVLDTNNLLSHVEEYGNYLDHVDPSDLTDGEETSLHTHSSDDIGIPRTTYHVTIDDYLAHEEDKKRPFNLKRMNRI